MEAFVRFGVFGGPLLLDTFPQSSSIGCHSNSPETGRMSDIIQYTCQQSQGVCADGQVIG